MQFLGQWADDVRMEVPDEADEDNQWLVVLSGPWWKGNSSSHREPFESNGFVLKSLVGIY